MEVKNNEFQRAFEANKEGLVISLEYSIQEKKIFLTKLVLSEDIQSDEILNEFLKEVLIMIEDMNLRVVPTSSKVAAFFRKNPKYKSMLPPGIVV